MKPASSTTLALIALALAGCSGMMPPSANDMAQIPTVRFGDEAPAGKEFAILYPAGIPLPATASIKGSLLEKSDEATLHVTLKRDVYIFRNWVSFDGKNWQRSDKLVGGKFEIEIPGTRTGKNPGKLSAEFDQKGSGNE